MTIATIKIWLANLKENLTPRFLRMPDFPEMNYKSVAEYIERRQNVLINYNYVVIAIGFMGLLISLAFFYCLYHRYGNIIYSHKEFFPSAIWSIMVTAFNGIELEARKKELFIFLKKKLPDGSWEDAMDLLKSMKDLSWEEFKNYFE